jgi:predicted kinase
MIVIMAGLPGSGKSTLARELGVRTAGVVLDKDRVRSALFPPEDIEYSAGQDDFCMGVLFQAAGYLLKQQPGRFVFIDGRPFSRREQIEQVVRCADELGQQWRILECVCSTEAARKRLQEQAGKHLAANRNYAVYLRMKEGWEPILRPKTVIDTDRAIEDCVREAAQAIGIAFQPGDIRLKQI